VVVLGRLVVDRTGRVIVVVRLGLFVVDFLVVKVVVGDVFVVEVVVVDVSLVTANKNTEKTEKICSMTQMLVLVFTITSHISHTRFNPLIFDVCKVTAHLKPSLRKP